MKGDQGSIEQYRDNRPSGFETMQIGAIEVSLMLFRQFDKNCVNLVTELQNQGAAVERATALAPETLPCCQVRALAEITINQVPPG
jgi:hypothetical protein